MNFLDIAAECFRFVIYFHCRNIINVLTYHKTRKVREICTYSTGSELNNIYIFLPQHKPNI